MVRTVQIAFLFLLIISISEISFARGKIKRVSLLNFELAINTKDKHKITNNGQQPLLFIEGKKSKGFAFAKKAAPQSILTIKNRIKELKGNKKTLEVLKSKEGVIFYFQSKEGTHFFSTKGGYLFASQSLNLRNKETIKKRLRYVASKK